MEFDINTIVNYGALGACLAYFMWERSSSMKKFTDTLNELKELIQVMRAEVKK